ncbi:response regulator transcription factor [Dyella monticola]|nr:response regulator transcription factor [Dyella monticola]
MADRRLFAYANPSLRVAVLDQDAPLRESVLLPTLRDAGFQAHGLTSAMELYRSMLAQSFDIVVLDADLPGESGYDIAQHLRATSDIGIVMLTDADWRHAPIQALTSGADFYLHKPVDANLLTAMLRSLSRRLIRAPSHGAIADHARARGWQLDADGWRLSSPHGGVVALTTSEHSLVNVLAKENGRIMTREALIDAIAHDVYDFDPHRLEMTIHRLRRKTYNVTGETLPLRTVRGRGYLFSCDVTPEKLPK